MENKETNFEEYVKKVMDDVVKTHQHNHPLYRETRITNYIVDKEKERAAFVLFEQIDTDRCSQEGAGYFGNQYRYSVWYIQGYEKPKQIYEDHAWINERVSPSSDVRGREAYIGLEKLLEDGVIAQISPKETKGISYSPMKKKITLEGKIEEPEDFMEQARNLVISVGSRLGCDYLSGEKRIPGKDIAAIVWSAENGRDYGHDTVYLVWRKNGKVNYKRVTDSSFDKSYLHIRDLRDDGDEIVIDLGKKGKVKINKEELE
ncbi:MAG: hypothetical protein QW117_02440 [Candidatus Pacearchaeota archaeon]